MTFSYTNNSEPIKVLHVDDEQNNLIISKLILEEIIPEIKIDTTDSTKTVEQTYHQYDCILSDYNMPQKTGIQLAQSIREKSDIPFILYTGQGSEEVAEAAFIAGIDDYIRKETHSAHYQVVAKRIQVAVERHRAQKRLERSEASLAKAQEIAHLGNWDWNIVDNELYWSDEIYRTFGRKPQEFGATYEAFLRARSA
jgi:response regulator RpfG family c-di-GMP phosphodiesterase